MRPSAQWYACEEKFSDIENTRKKRMDEAVKEQLRISLVSGMFVTQCTHPRRIGMGTSST